MTNTNLREIFDHYAELYGYTTHGEMSFAFTDKGSNHTYIEFYTKYMEPKREDVSLLEIGIMTGGSFLLWQKYFEKYKLVGIDLAETFYKIKPFQKDIESDPNIQLYFNTDSTRVVPKSLSDNKFDFIIDDGNHNLVPQTETLINYWPYLKDNGTYFIEDVSNSSYIKTFTKALEQLNAKFTFEVYEGIIDKRHDDRIFAVTKSI